MTDLHYFTRLLQEANTTAESSHDEDKPWGAVIGAAFMVQMVTFSGIFLAAFVSCFKRLRKNRDVSGFLFVLYQQVIPSFAAGALLATAVFLLIPESMELLGGGHGDEHVEESVNAEQQQYDDHDHEHRRYLEDIHQDESGHNHNAVSWKFGTALTMGFLLPILLGALFPPPDTQNCKECRELERQENGSTSSSVPPSNGRIIAEPGYSDGEDANHGNEEEDEVVEIASSSFQDRATVDLDCDEGICDHENHHHNNDCDHVDGDAKQARNSKKQTKLHHSRNMALASSILVGDFFHNFCDGVFLGTAFLLCSKSLAWTMTATTIYHELAQEIADYGLLTRHCGLTAVQALTANFVSGFSVMIGALLIFVVEMPDSTIGAILTMSAGVYLYIAASECIPKIQALRETWRDTLIFVACFIVGAVPIGLVLLNHGHCEAGH
jgi:zinc transporter ZupT